MLAGAMLIGIRRKHHRDLLRPSWAPAVAFGFLLLTLAVRRRRHPWPVMMGGAPAPERPPHTLPL